MSTRFIIKGLQADRMAIALDHQNQTNLALKGLNGGTEWHVAPSVKPPRYGRGVVDDRRHPAIKGVGPGTFGQGRSWGACKGFEPLASLEAPHLCLDCLMGPRAFRGGLSPAP